MFLSRITLSLLFLSGCAPFCTGTLLSEDVVMTARHCVPETSLREAALGLPQSVRPGDALTFWGCGGEQRGLVASVEDGRAYVNAPVCGGDSGGPVTKNGVLVGVVVARVLGSRVAIVELLRGNFP